MIWLVLCVSIILFSSELQQQQASALLYTCWPLISDHLFPSEQAEKTTTSGHAVSSVELQLDYSGITTFFGTTIGYNRSATKLTDRVRQMALVIIILSSALNPARQFHHARRRFTHEPKVHISLGGSELDFLFYNPPDRCAHLLEPLISPTENFSLWGKPGPEACGRKIGISCVEYG